MKEIIVYKENESTVTALIENGKITEKYEQEENKTVFEGNIYCGIVRNILPGMQSAFIDIGETKNAFMHIKDILPKVSNRTGNKEEKFEKYDINQFLKSGMPILVQVKKDEEDKKGARVSKHINLTGKYAVLMPNVDFITISKKIENKEIIEELKNIAVEILAGINTSSEKYGLILRTAAEKTAKEKIEKDVKILVKLWKKIKSQYEKSIELKKPIQIYASDEILVKLLMGAIKDEDTKIYTNSEENVEMIEETLKIAETSKAEVEVKKNIENLYDFSEQIKKSKDRKVWLKCGGFITIDKTEALTAIDVNSGKFIGDRKKSKEDTIYKVNMEATIEIAKQLRLRNISGIIVIDYIDMEQDDERNEILEILSKELKKDRTKTQVMGFTKLDLLEITRKKI